MTNYAIANFIQNLLTFLTHTFFNLSNFLLRKILIKERGIGGS